MNKKNKKQKPLETKWIALIILGLVAFIMLSSFALYKYYTEPIVAKINGINIRASQVIEGLSQAASMVLEEAVDLPDDEYQRLVREQAVKNLAPIIIFVEHARRLYDLGLLEESISEMNEQELVAWVVWTIVNDPNELAAFEAFMPTEEVIDAKEIAQGILDRLLAGEDFDTLMAEYGEDPGMQTNPEGYTFAANMMVQEFEDATRELEIGEISGLVETVHGIHIILRIEPNPEDELFGPFEEDEELLGAKHILIGNRPSLLDMQQQAVYEGILASAENADIRFLRALNNITLDYLD